MGNYKLGTIDQEYLVLQVKRHFHEIEYPLNSRGFEKAIDPHQELLKLFQF
jgi:hypothetical protein